MSLSGMQFTLTGTFPYLGALAYEDNLSDATGRLDIGKDGVTQLIVSNGGTVTSSVSGNTNYLLAGVSPGVAKLEKAARAGTAQLIDLEGLGALMAGGQPEPVTIDVFSTGYGGNTLGCKRGKVAVEALLMRGQKRKRDPSAA